MADNTIELRNIRSLSRLNFFIPDYQRGYRWSSTEARLMLEDFKEFCDRDNKARGEFYCLQPIVVKKKTWIRQEEGQQVDVEGYEVIDGQQRLTTLYILLKCLEDTWKVMYKKYVLYKIKYETRLEYDSQLFLENINLGSNNSNDCIDFFYMRQVYDTVNLWLDENDDYRRYLTDALLDQKPNDNNTIDKANNIRVIWYEVSETDSSSSIDIFTRLNIGKIPLTNAELIKALLLRRGNFSDREATLKQIQIASEWNLIEQRLQDDDFWYFACSSSWPFKYENRIEYIFDLMKGRTKDSEFYFTFIQFNEELEQLNAHYEYHTKDAGIEFVWQKVKNVFQTLEEWYEERALFHYIGFLIEYGADINEMMQKSLEMRKNDFLNHFIKETKIKDLMKGIKLEDLSYGDKNVKKVLLLFNILTVLQSNKSDMRFPFSKYKTGHWDIEHICSQTDKRITENGQRLAWIDDMLEFFVGSTQKDVIEKYKTRLECHINELKKEEISNINKNEGLAKLVNEYGLLNKILSLLPATESAKVNDIEFDEIFSAVQKYFGEDKLEDKDNIYNLTLLDAQTNRGYGNAFFPIKRRWIIENDRNGIFVPIVTKNVFLKYYSRKGNNLMYWEQSDAEDYLSAMEETLKEYIQ